MTAAKIARVYNGTRSGDGWLIRCPTHDDHNPSCSISDGKNGKLLVKCFAGCDPRKVLNALRERGLLQGKHIDMRHIAQSPGHIPPNNRNNDATRIKTALRLWSASRQVRTGSPVDIYLHRRGLTLSVAEILREHIALKHPDGSYWPAMMALVQRGIDGQSIGIHRTFLAQHGEGKAPVNPEKVKMMLGPCRGGAVRLAQPSNLLMIGEGIETCLAAMQAMHLPAWAALSTSGLVALDLPHEVQEVIVLADGDDPGEKAAQAAAMRWKREGRKVRIARPPRGLDFNDLLLGKKQPNETGGLV